MIKLENYSRDIIVLCVQKTSIQLSMSKDLVLDELQNIYPNIISSVIKMEPMLFKFPIKTIKTVNSARAELAFELKKLLGVDWEYCNIYIDEKRKKQDMHKPRDNPQDFMLQRGNLFLNVIGLRTKDEIIAELKNDIKEIRKTLGGKYQATFSIENSGQKLVLTPNYAELFDYDDVRMKRIAKEIVAKLI